MIVNRSQLAAGGMAEVRATCLRVAAAGLRACDAGRGVAEAVEPTDEGISIAGRMYPLGQGARVVLIGSGKATWAIASALEEVLGDRLDGGVIAVQHVPAGPTLERVEVLRADHPLPSRRSEAAARRMLDLVSGLGESDLALAAFTGGSSALTSLPPRGVSQDEKKDLHRLLLSSGAPIAEVNTVRKHVSAFKGGRLAACAEPARLANLAVSDVAGDVLDVLTDPSVQDTSTAEDAVRVLHRRGIWDDVAPSIRRHLGSADAHSPQLTAEPQTVLLVSGAKACEAMKAEASAVGMGAHIVSTSLEGEANLVGGRVAELAMESAREGTPLGRPCVLIGCGGESTVTLAGGAEKAFGAGGPNQEAAAAAALHLEDGTPISACFIDTDGSDGGTDAAGAIVDGLTVQRAGAIGIDLATALAEHRSGDAFSALGDQIITGPTQTNVNDLFVVAIGNP